VLPPSVKRQTTAEICYIKTGMKNANAQNNTFASPDTQADASACKRFVFLPMHPSPPTTLDNSLTRIEINRKIN
jgi:hypothetical protein